MKWKSDNWLKEKDMDVIGQYITQTYNRVVYEIRRPPDIDKIEKEPPTFDARVYYPALVR